jgi:hypothetical protein
MNQPHIYAPSNAWRTISIDAGTFMKQYREQHKAAVEGSWSRTVTRVMERLGETDPQIASALRAHEAAQDGKQPRFFPPPERIDILKRYRLLDLPESGKTNPVLLTPRLVSVRAIVTGENILSADPAEVARALTRSCSPSLGYPKWDDEVFSTGGGHYWRGWGSNDTARASCLAGVSGSGVWEDEETYNTATWGWIMSAHQTEDITVYIGHYMTGPCAYRTDSGEVTLWLIYLAEVKKWVPPATSNDDWTEVTIASIPQHNERVWSTNDGLAENGPPPQGGFYGGTTSDGPYMAGTLEGDELRFTAEEGNLYTIYSGVCLCLTANMKAAIAVGYYAGSFCDPLKITGYCLLCPTG